MASLFTNASAQTALQTLTKASKSLSATQNRVSTGYRINTAEDNAAYWSIATTLRSDVGALGAVKDALGLGAATIDTVYTGINDTKDLLDQIKSKLVTASQSGVPRDKVQAEITQLQNRLADVSKSTVINSETWLTQDSTANGYNHIKTVVGSFTRAAGVISIDNIEIDIRGTKLYETATSLHTAADTALGSASAAATAYTAAIVAATGASGTLETARAAAVNVTTGFGALAANGTTGAIATVANFTSAVTHGATADLDGAPASVITGAGGFGEVAHASTAILGAERKSALVIAINARLTALGAAHNGDVGATGQGELAGLNTGNADDRAKIVELTAAAKTDILKLVNDAFDAAAAEQLEAAHTAYRAAATGNASNAQLGIFDKIRVAASNSSGGDVKAISVKNIDISRLTDTDFDKALLTSYLTAVDDALTELTLSASIVGAAKSRIEGNKTFVQNLIDANNRGIGQLVDADLNEESSKLKALQVQEQLAIQALSIANNSTQNILSLFQ